MAEETPTSHIHTSLPLPYRGAGARTPGPSTPLPSILIPTILIPTARVPTARLASLRLTPRYIDPSSSDESDNMVGKVSKTALLRDEGLERTDNGMKLTSWPDPQPINQKNYYTDFMKRDDQLLTLRLQNEANRDRMIKLHKEKDRALARTGDTEIPLPFNGEGEAEEEEDANEDGSKGSMIIVIHPGSQNLRIGFANDALPRTVPMTVAQKWNETESEEYEPRPRRQKAEAKKPEEQFGDDFSKNFTKMSADLKLDMRANKRKVLPNSKELVINYNNRLIQEEIATHNDPMHIEWTDVSKLKDKFPSVCGTAAQRVPDDSKPPYKLFWPIQNGWANEKDYNSEQHLYHDLEHVIEGAMRQELKLSSLAWESYSCIFIVPDLYDKKYVEALLRIGLEGYEFNKVCFVQESLAATFGAGYTSACVVDVGAQKTSICCVEDGMCIEDSRVNLKYGGYDVTETFIKMILYDHFPYTDINLKRRYDFLLAEELKINYCTMNQVDISVQLYNFHLRTPNQKTQKYSFKTYDEVILAPMGFFDPSIFDNSDKLVGRRKHVDRSYNAYEPDQPDDPTSSAQLEILTSIKPSLASTTTNGTIANGIGNLDLNATPHKEKSNPLNLLGRVDSDANSNSRLNSAAASPAPEGSTPVPSGPFVFGANGTSGGSPAPGGAFQFGNNGSHAGTPAPPGMFVDPNVRTAKDIAIERDTVLPIAPLDSAIITSITHACMKGEEKDEKKFRDFLGGIMVIGGGAKTLGFSTFLEERLKLKMPKLKDKVLVGANPKEMDGEVVVWKGGSIFGRLTFHDSWLGREEYDKLGSRALHHKVLWNW